MKTQDTLYDKVILAERLEDLRKGDGKKRHTLKKLSKEIDEKTGVYISHTQLSKYENPDKQDSMSINNLLALASFYNVTIDYLLGRTTSKSHNYTTQMTSNRFGLSDKALEKLAFKTNNKSSGNNQLAIKIINYILENNWFINELVDNLMKYYKANDDNADIQEDIATFNLIKTLEIFRDKTKEEIWDKEYKNKPIYLFELPKQLKSKKKEKK